MNRFEQFTDRELFYIAEALNNFQYAVMDDDMKVPQDLAAFTAEAYRAYKERNGKA